MPTAVAPHHHMMHCTECNNKTRTKNDSTDRPRHEHGLIARAMHSHAHVFMPRTSSKNHRFVFPLMEESMFNPDAPTVTPQLMATLRQSETARNHMITSFRRMLRFYGFQV